MILTLLGVAVGFTVGFILSSKDPSKSALLWIGMHLFLINLGRVVQN